MSIYDSVIQGVADGAPFRTDFRRRTLRVAGKAVIYNGKFVGELGVTPLAQDEFLAEVEHLYGQYKHSVPSERSDRRRFPYFAALSEEQLTDEDMLFGQPREVARARLEVFLLCGILNGSFRLPGNGWFWQSPNDSDLVLLREWGVNL